MDKDPDARLVLACRNGDRVAYETLLTRYERPIFNVAIRMLGNPEDARDVVQTVFVRVFEKLHQFNFEHRFYSWIYRIAINESIDVLHSRNRTSALEEGEQDDLAVDGTPLDDCHDAQRDAALQAAIMNLSPDYRAAIVLRHFADRSYQEMAEILGIPEKTVKSRLFTARQLLRAELEAGGMGEA